MMKGVTNVETQTRISIETEEDILEEVEEKEIKIEELRAELKEAKDELRAARLRQQELEILLRSGTSDSSTIPKNFHAGYSPGTSEMDRSLPDSRNLQSLLLWIAGEVDLDKPSVWIQQNGTLEFGHGEKRISAILGRTQQWELKRFPGLRLSVPEEVVPSITSLLRTAQRGETLDQVSMARLASDWEIVMGQASGEEPNPLYALNTRDQLVIIIATWPKPYFDASTYFMSLRSPNEAKVASHGPVEVPATCSGPSFAPAPEPIVKPEQQQQQQQQPQQVPPSEAPSSELSAHIVETPSDPYAAFGYFEFYINDRVEVFYHNRWYPGTVRMVAENKYGVHCDEDVPGIMTYATPDSMRRLVTEEQGQPQSAPFVLSTTRKHRRAKSAPQTAI